LQGVSEPLEGIHRTVFPTKLGWSGVVTAAEQASEMNTLATAHPPGRESLIPILQDIRDRFGYLSAESVAEVSRLIGVSENEIYGVATFYTCFRFTPPGEHTIHACLGTACHVRGGQQILREFENQLGIKESETTPDGKFSLERVACVGCCALAPVALVDNEVNAGMAPKKVRPLLKKYAKSNPKDAGAR
jgi:NADH-quinone oxidoreductase subunit E